MGILFHLHRVGTGDALLPWMIPPSLTNFSDPIPHLFVAPLTRGSHPLWKGRKNVADRDLRDEGMTSFPGTGRGLGRKGPQGPSIWSQTRALRPCLSPAPYSFPWELFTPPWRHSKKTCLSLGGFSPPGCSGKQSLGSFLLQGLWL